VIFYQSIEDLTQAEVSAKPLIICPSPLVADGLRRLMPDDSEIITISKWVTDYLKKENQKRSNKAELMLRLSSVWRHYFPKEESHYFFKSFEMFTDLRSFSLNLELLSEFLKEIDPVTTKSILLFWTFLENEKLIDEHKSYQLLSEIEIDRPLWIIGFKHLSGIQIDMLKAIGEKTEVNVFFPKEVYAETLNTDWIRWLVPESDVQLETPERRLKIAYFPKNKLNVVLNALKKQIPQFDIALASPHVSFNAKQEVNSHGQFLKSPEDLFSIKREKLIEEFSEILEKKSLPIEEINKLIEEKKQSALEGEDYIRYKILLLLTDALTFYGEFQTSVDSFALKVLKMILELNSPRVSLASLIVQPQTRLLDLNELPYKENDYPLAMIATSHYGPLKTGESKYSERMIEALRVIAPLKRSGLDFAYLKSELMQTLSDPNNILLIEEGLELVDLAWREILKEFSLEVVTLEVDYELKEKRDYLKAKIKPGPYAVKNFSASRLQTFIDCPRKYYFSYIEKIDHRPEERLKISADEMGTIEHKIIENYFLGKRINETLVFDPGEHRKLCETALNEFISQHKIILNEKSKLTTYFELVHYTQNGIEYLIEYLKSQNAISIEFEKALGENPWGIVGSIDCLVHLPGNNVALFDFKRSGAAIGSKKDTLLFDKVQIWIYLIIMIRHQQKTVHTWGYLNLSEIEASQVYNEEESPLLSEKILDDFQALMLKNIENLKTEKTFKGQPRLNKICDFCEVQLFCDKGSCLQ
jgi:RecB family exonuclease